MKLTNEDFSTQLRPGTSTRPTPILAAAPGQHLLHTQLLWTYPHPTPWTKRPGRKVDRTAPGMRWSQRLPLPEATYLPGLACELTCSLKVPFLHSSLWHKLLGMRSRSFPPPYSSIQGLSGVTPRHPCRGPKPPAPDTRVHWAPTPMGLGTLDRQGEMWTHRGSRGEDGPKGWPAPHSLSDYQDKQPRIRD